MRPLLLVVAVAALTGCTATRTVSSTADLAEARRALEGRAATVTFRDGTVADGYALHLAPDTTSFLDARTHALVAVPTAAIAGIRQFSRERGARRGVRTGAIAGAVAGGVGGGALGNAVSTICFSSTPCPSGGERAQITVAAAGMGAVMGAGVGALYGVVVGAIVGRADEFWFDLGPAEATPPPEGR